MAGSLLLPLIRTTFCYVDCTKHFISLRLRATYKDNRKKHVRIPLVKVGRTEADSEIMGNCVKSPQSTDSTDMTVIHGKVPDPPKSVDPTPPDDRYVKSDIQKPPPVADKPTRRPSQDNSAIDPAEAEARRMKQLVAELINSGYDTI